MSAAVVISNLATARYDTSLRSQGPIGGNWTVSSHDQQTSSITEGCLQIENFLTVLNTANATNYGLASISTKGGLDIARDLLCAGSGTFHSLIANTASITSSMTVGGPLSASTALLLSSSSSALTIPNGGLNANSATLASLLVSGTSTLSQDVLIASTTESTAVDTGALCVKGGGSFSKSLSVANNITSTTGTVYGQQGQFKSSNDSTNGMNASLSTLGGLFVTKDGTFGGQMRVFAGGSATPSFRVDTSGIHFTPDGTNDVLWAQSNALLLNAPTTFSNTATPSDFTGANAAVSFLGGVGVQKDMWLKGNLYLQGAIKADGTVLFDNTSASTSPNTGAVVVGGGLGVNTNIFSGGSIIGGAGSAPIPATNSSTGALQAIGGLGVSGDAFIDGKLTTGSVTSGNIVGATGTLNALAITSTATPATKADTNAALSVAGGMVVSRSSYFNDTLAAAGNAFFGGDMYMAGKVLNTLAKIITTPTGFQLLSPPGASVDAVSDTAFRYIDGTSNTAVTRFQVTSTSARVKNTSNATSPQNAGFVVEGGLGVAMDQYLGGKLFVQDTSATSISTLGGSTIGTFLTVGKDVTVTGNTNLSSSLNVGGLTTINSTLNANAANIGGALTTGGVFTAQSAANITWTGPTSATGPIGSMITKGGGGSVLDWQVGQNLTVYNNLNVSGKSVFANDVVISSTTSSTSATPQALQVAGGASFGKGTVTTGPAIVFGDFFLYGNMTQTGTTSNVNVSNYYVNDNIITLNVNTPYPDSGLSFTRYQYANDTASGFVVGDAPYITFNVAATSTDSVTLKLPSSASTVDNFYNGWLMIISGTGNKQVRSIKSYKGSTQTITIRSTADQTAYNGTNPPPQGGTNVTYGMDFTIIPDTTSVVSFYNNTVGAFLQQQLGTSGPQFALGYLANDPLGSTANNTFASYGDLKLKRLFATQSVLADTLLPFAATNLTLNNSVTVSPTGRLNNVVAINGAPTQQMFTVTVSESATALGVGGASITVGKTWGTLTYTVSPIDASGSTTCGTVTTNTVAGTQGYSPNVNLTQLPGVNGEQVTVVWTNGNSPIVTLATPRSASKLTGSPITYNIFCTVY